MKTQTDRFKKRSRSPVGGIAALAGFAVLCGIVLLMLGQGISCDGKKQREQNLTHELIGALRATQQAHQALEDKNYGAARQHVRMLQERLTNALSRLEALPEEQGAAGRPRSAARTRAD